MGGPFSWPGDTSQRATLPLAANTSWPADSSAANLIETWFSQMPVSSDAAFVAAIWGLLTADPVLKQLFGGNVRLYLDWGQPDSELPYIVHTLETEGQDPFPMRSGRYVLDVWDYAETATRILKIQNRVTQLLDALWLPLDDGPDGARMGLVRWRPIVEDTKYIWRRSSEWSVRFYATEETQGILERG